MAQLWQSWPELAKCLIMAFCTLTFTVVASSSPSGKVRAVHSTSVVPLIKVLHRVATSSPCNYKVLKVLNMLKVLKVSKVLKVLKVLKVFKVLVTTAYEGKKNCSLDTVLLLER